MMQTVSTGSSPLQRVRPRRLRTAAALLALAAGLAAASAPVHAHAQCAGAPAANLALGVVCGVVQNAEFNNTSVPVNAFLGIRYAQPPTGSLRWQPPQPVTQPWSTPQQDTAFGSICPQFQNGAFAGNEDCLFLNVWAPRGATPASALPVMVFIHGGAFIGGSGSLPQYNGGALAASGNVVVVTLNYRLGALGFLYRPARNIHGNFGLLDQQLALRWVQRNIRAFGGDSTRVTIFGESAGAMSVGLHLFSMPSSNTLFRAAIMESNPMGVPYRTSEWVGATIFIDELCKVAQIGLVQCLEGAWRRATQQQVMIAQQKAEIEGTAARVLAGGLSGALPWTPVVDGKLVMSQPQLGYHSPSLAKPFIFGTNASEGVVFAGFAQADRSVALPRVYLGLLERSFLLNSGKILATSAYSAKGPPIAPLGDTATALANVITDFAFDCGSLLSADSAYKANSVRNLPIYGYHFEQPPFFNGYSVAATDSACLGPDFPNVCHGYELPYVFNTLGAAVANPANPKPVAPTPRDVTLANSMSAAWVQFATSLTVPQGWQPYTPGGSLYVWGGSNPGTMRANMEQTANCTSLWGRFPPLGR